MHENPEPAATEDPDGPQDPVLAIYDQALPRVYGYLLPRCGSVETAEDLTAETFLAAVAATRGFETPAENVSVPWLLGVARHKLVDHWRRAEREERTLAAAATVAPQDDPWDGHIDAALAHTALGRLNGLQRASLVLRHVDGLSVSEVAACVGRSIHATETLLVRARAALRRVYKEMEDADA